MAKNTFEENLENLDEIIEKLESGELSLDDAIKEYENAMKLIKTASKMLKEAILSSKSSNKWCSQIIKPSSAKISALSIAFKTFVVILSW